MKYRKPELSVLGDAALVIQITSMKDGSPWLDPVTGVANFNPAYDLDE